MRFFKFLFIVFCLSVIAAGFFYYRLYAAGYVGFLIKENKLKSTPYLEPKYGLKPKTWPANKIIAAWIGHATVLVKINGIYIITDPVLLKRIGPPEFFENMLGIRRITKMPFEMNDLPEIDIILISHAHYDHLCIPSLKRLLANQKKKPVIIVPRDTMDLVKDLKFYSIVELDWHKGKCWYKDKKVKIKAFRVEHYGYVDYKERKNPRGFNGYLIKSENKKIAFFGDTSYRRYRNYKGIWTGKGHSVNWSRQVNPGPGSIDLCIVPIGDSYYRANHLSPQDAVKLVLQVKGDKLLPVHYNTFLLSPPDKYPKDPKKVLINYLKKRKNLKVVFFRNLEKNKELLFPDIGLGFYID